MTFQTIKQQAGSFDKNIFMNQFYGGLDLVVIFSFGPLSKNVL